MPERKAERQRPFQKLSCADCVALPPCSVGDSATLVRNRRLGVRRVSRVLLDAADEFALDFPRAPISASCTEKPSSSSPARRKRGETRRLSQHHVPLVQAFRTWSARGE